MTTLFHASLHLLFLVTLHGAESVMSCRFYHIGGISPRNSVTSSVENFEGRLQQLVINGERVLDEAHLKQLEYEGVTKIPFRL